LAGAFFYLPFLSKALLPAAYPLLAKTVLPAPGALCTAFLYDRAG
jgi:hypothetical protein